MEVWLFGWVSLVASRGRSNSSKCGNFFFLGGWGVTLDSPMMLQ